MDVAETGQRQSWSDSALVIWLCLYKGELGLEREKNQQKDTIRKCFFISIEYLERADF